MAKFEIALPDGRKFEVEAPDQQTAWDALQTHVGGGQSATPSAPPPPDLDAEYQSSLERVRQTQFPQMSDAQWAEYSQKAFPRAGAKDLAQHSQLFGLTDEINAGLGALGSQVRQWTGGGGPGFGEAYGDYKALEEARRDAGREEMGGVGVAAEVLGGLSGFRGAPAVPRPLPNVPAAPLWQRMAASGGQGAAFGGAYAAGAADEDRLVEGAKGAAVGGVTGGLVPALAQGASAAYGNLANRFGANQAAAAIGTTPDAAAFLSRTMAADDSLGPIGRARMQAAGGEAMLADAGPSARNALDFAIQSSGSAGRLARTAIDARVSRDARAIQDALDAALGAPQGVQSTRTAIRLGSAPARSDAYRAAYGQEIDYLSSAGRPLHSLLQRLDPADITAANALLRKEGAPQMLTRVADDGTIVYLQQPSVQQIDYITRALNDRAANNAGLGVLGGQTNVGRVNENLARDLRDTVRTAAPEYGVALDTAADPIRRSQAVEFGASMLRPSTTREQVANQVLRMTGPERQAAQQGLRSQFDELLSNVTRTVNDGDMPAREAIAALRQLSSRANREKITVLLGQAEADRLFTRVDQATASFELRAGVADNSRTFQRQEMGARVDAFASPEGPIATVMRGEPVNAGKRLVQMLTGQTPEASLAQKEAMLEEVVRMLTAQQGRAVTAMEALRYLAATQGANSAVSNAILARGAQLVGPTSYSASQQVSPR